MKTKFITALCVVSLIISMPILAEVKISTKGGLKVSSGDYKFQLGGRIMYDYNRAEENGMVDEDGFDLRRGRIYMKGNVSKNWKFKSQYEFEGSEIKDMYLRYTGWGKAANVTIGNQKTPFGLEYQVSSKDISILERSSITERFILDRAEGVSLHGEIAPNNWYSVMLFTQDVEKEEKGEEFGYAARYAFAPIKTDNSVLHLGIAYRDIEDNSALGLEAAAAFGPFHVQGEYFDGETGSSDIDGYYVQLGYMLTGEMRPYKGGKFKRAKPKSKTGAWELVARYEDGDGKFSDIELGKTNASSYTIGLNWYAHKNIRLGINYTDGEDNNSDDEGEEFRVRFQLTF